jgi:anti-anti-sigma factor
MNLTLLSTEGDIHRFECAGEITQSALYKDPNPLERMLGAGCYKEKVLISLARADYTDSAGVGWFITCNKKFRDVGGKMVLHSIPPMVNHIFQLLRMQTVLHLAGDEAAALAMVQGDRP